MDKIKYPYKIHLLALVLVTLVVGAAQPVAAQQLTYGQEWINFGQKYYKIKVPATGIYRLDQAYLQAAGISGVDPRNFQLYRRGKEVAIHVAGESDGSLDAGDYIEFYGEQNDGQMDRELYKNPDADHINTYYSLYTDTAAYFLTWSTAAGKRMSTYNQSSTGLAPENWHWQDRIIFDNGQYTRGRRYGENYMSWMDAGEGFAGGSTSGFTFNLPAMMANRFSGGPAPKVEIAMVGANENDHEVDVFVKPPSGPERLVGTFTLKDYGSAKQLFPLEYSDFFADGKLVLRITARNTSSRYRTLYFKTIYAQQNSFSSVGLPFINFTPSSSPSYYVFEGASAANAFGYDVSSHENVRRVPGTVNGTQKGFVFPASFTKGLLWSGAALIPPAAQEVKFRNLAGNQSNFLIVTHKLLMQPTGSSTNPVKEYAAYRASAAGGGYDTLVMHVDQIYNQFFFGDKSAAAIRRLMKYLMATGQPKYLLLLGKGLEYDNIKVRKDPASLPYQDLVPTGGTPGSDIFFTADWETGSFTPKVATGRIPANTSAEVLAYLEKVKVHESLPQNLPWRKNILHLVGGTAGSEQNTLASYMRSYERIAEGKFLGANVLTKLKSTSSGLDTINIAKELNAGLSLVTFFGHSSTTTSDLDVGLVSNVLTGYKNTGKYPMLLMNGCNAGNSFILAKSFGEDWLLTPEKGAIAFLAHDSYGYPSLLNVYSLNFYSAAFNNPETYGQPLGDQQAAAIQKIEQTVGGDNVAAMLMQMVLQADPALVLVGPEKPDYAVSSGDISLQSLDGNEVTATSESFALNVVVQNWGKVGENPFQVMVTRKLENGTELRDSVLVPPVYYKDTVQIVLKGAEDGAGVNIFSVTIDPKNEVDELEEANNSSVFEYFFSRSGVLALGPTEYGIVQERQVKLIGQSTNLMIPARDYYFELDTTYQFNSAFLKKNIVNAGSLPVWEVTLPENTSSDSVVYFWRLRYNEFFNGEDTVWAVSSFRHIPASIDGWSQGKYGQLAKASVNGLVTKPEMQKMEFSPLYKTIEIKGGGGGHRMSREAPFGIFIDNAAYFWDNCGYTRANILAIVFNNVTLEPYVDMPAGAGARCGLSGTIVYQFSNLATVANQDALERFLKAVPDNFHVALVGINSVPYSSFKPSLKAAFNEVGSSVIDQLQTGDPFILLGQKGAAKGTALEKGANEDDPTERPMQSVQLERRLEVNGMSGTLTSTIIGPAKKWNSLHHQMLLSGDDSYKLEVIGIKANKEETVLWSDVKESDFNISSVNAAIFPYLKLRLTLKDETDRTAPQLKQWTVLYEGVPEGLIRPDLVGLEKYNTEALSAKATDGQLDLQFAFNNVSNVSFSDSITVETVVFQENGGKLEKTFRVKPLGEQETVFFNYAFNTLNMKGNNRLRVTVNPRGIPETQLEQIYTNNVLEIPFTVGQYAGLPPTLDVVFDGNRILDGDIVSPSPVISMVLKDHAKKLPITDPSSVKVYLKKDDGPFAEINVSTDNDIKFFPADGENDFRVEYTPDLEDGNYTLQVQGQDAMGQSAGTERFSINFQVISESSISNFYPYPNPFSSKTRFVFTLTGHTVPERMKLQIMTVTGKVIKEVQREELGPIKIGNNITEFAWDGTDEFGDRLANGVYLYRVVMDNGPEEMKRYNTGKEKAFTKEYGKVYILR